MRRVIASTFVSLDGVMQAPGAPDEDRTGGFALGGWVCGHWDEATDKVISELFARPFDLLLGRKTYEIFAAHWPYIENDPIAERFNAATKYVAASSDAPLAWRNSVAINGNVAARVTELKASEGPDLVIQGSSVLFQSLLAEGLIDEFTLLTFPLVLGRGKRLFGNGGMSATVKLEHSAISGLGVQIAR
ncbi:MAG: dihydrofolate reductase family protein, partial [Allosphingosinicella sp.]